MSRCRCYGPTMCSLPMSLGAQQLIRAYERTSSPVLALMPMPPSNRVATVCPVVKEDLDDGLLRITGLIEKPEPEDAPSPFAAIGGYVLTPGVIESCGSRPSAGTSTGPARFI